MNGACTPSVEGAEMAIGGHGQVISAPAPPVIWDSNIPPGLEYLLTTSQITIQVASDRGGDAMAGITSTNRYYILDDKGQRMYLAEDKSDSSCACQTGPWTINVLDSFGQPVMQGKGEAGCSCCCCCCCGCFGFGGNNGAVHVFTADGQQLGSIISNFGGCCSSSWDITDGRNKPLLRLKAPTNCTCGKEYPLLTAGRKKGRTKVGKITTFSTSHISGFRYGVEFPADLDVTLKGTLLFAPLMIDMNYYECSRNNPGFDYGY